MACGHAAHPFAAEASALRCALLALAVTLAILAPSASASIIQIQGGSTPVFTRDYGPNIYIEIYDGSATFTTLQHLGGLTIYGSNLATLTAGGDKILVLDTTFFLAGSGSAYTARLDLNDNYMVVKAGGTNPTVGSWTGTAYSGVTGMLASAYAGGHWTAGGIQSTTASQDTKLNHGLGVLTGAQAQANGNNVVTAGFHGETVTTNDVLVQYGWNGDLNFDGTVSYLDYGVIDSAYLYNKAHPATPERGYNYGDLNFDGAINYLDYGIIDNAYLTSHQPHSAAMAATSVPEPSTVCALGLTGLLMASLRRRGPMRNP